MSTASTQFHWDDPFMLHSQLTDEERQVKEAAAALRRLATSI
jgi:hypothetical protein